LVLLDGVARRREIWTSLLLVMSVCSSGIGIPFLLATAALLIAREEQWRSLWILAPPAAVFIAWYIGWGTGEHVTSASVLGTPQFVADAASAGVSGIAGLSNSWGPPLATVALVVLALVVRGRSSRPILVAATAGAIAFWVLTGITRSDALASRYVYVSAVFILLIAGEACGDHVIRGARLAVGG